MIQKISDFKIAEFLLRTYCKIGKTLFIDLPLNLVKGAVSSYQANGLTISPQEKLNKTCFLIIGTYVSFADIISKTPPQITNEEKVQFMAMTIAILRDLTYSKASTTADVNGSVILKLNRAPLMWILMRDIICPTFNRPILNIPVISGRSGSIDGAAYLKEGIGKISEPLVFNNLEIDNPHCRDAFLLFETLRAHDLNPEAVVSEIFNKPEISSKVLGLARAAYVSTEGINDFIMTLCLLAGYKGAEDVLIHEANNKWNTKAGIWSQAQTSQGTMWWHFGLIEKMLGPARGPDWTGYFNTKPITDDLHRRVEEERKRRNLPELPLELLLRVQSEEFKQKTDLTIQALLADNRVW